MKQKRLLVRLKEYTVKSHINCHKKIYDTDNSIKTFHQYNNENSVYRILLIYGGAGTSTGGFICATLSMPDLSSSKPHFLATDLLEFYLNKKTSIFTRNHGIF
ncbi:hypothetical protein F8M41_014057 [Gigaspora margarita]|uniref:Uncharacterized protein n=1 Tax=Gigaspora margarita TaxID=4874 RepID=A0A8H4ENS3_GIGMA|nr:hypothetical protein F8M41_014057 [Gigaspora margarita]